MTDNEMPPQCRAQLVLGDSGPYRCTLVENHAVQHQDSESDRWDIEYADEPGVSPQAAPVDIRVRPAQYQLTALTARVGLLEAAWTVGGEPLSERLDRVFMALRMDASRLHTRLNELERRLNPVCGHRDPSSGRVCQKAPDHYGEVHRDMTSERDGLAWTTGHSSEEHRAGQEPTVIATQTDGRQVMSDGSVRDPELERVTRVADGACALDCDATAQPPENEAVLIDPVELGKLREAAGVDNWEGYGHAMQIMREGSND